MNLEELNAPFPANEVSWRIGQAGKASGGQIWAKVLAYIDNRCIMDRLDKVVGKANWKNEYAKGPEGGVLCGISIKIEGEWVTKWDGADNTDVEATKGGLSDSMKRAAVQWGIGRYLYDLGENFAQVVDKGTKGAHYANCKVKVNGKEEYATFHWLPPQNVLPDAKTEPLKVAGRAPDSQDAARDQHKQKLREHTDARRKEADDKWIAKAVAEIAKAQNLDDLNAIFAEAKEQSGYVIDRVKPELSKRKLELQAQPA